jgi:RimJ/RimL family protein N-acetyltransferase
MHRIWAGCLAENTASARVLEKLGMRLEGRLRDNEFFKGSWWDALIYAILDHEWQPGPENHGSAQNDSHQSAGLRFRRAIAADAPRLTEIAFAAKRYWGYPERWIVVWRDQLIITEDYVNSHQVILAENEEVISGFYGLSIDDSKAGLDYLWVDPPRIGQGIGRTLLEHACQTATSLGAERMEIIADPNAEGFYRRMGAEKIGESVYELEGQIRRLPLMVLQLDERYGA